MLNIEIQKKILKNVISLEEYDLYDLAWKKNDAINLIDSLIADKIGILGGDVYKLIPKGCVPVYDNWFFQPLDSETEEEYFLRSKIGSLKYIKNYILPDHENIVFSITFIEQF